MTVPAMASPRRASRKFLAAAWIGAVLYGLVGLLSLASFASGRDEGIHRVHDLASLIDFGLLAGVALATQLRERWRSVALAQLALLVAIVLAVLYGIPLAATGVVIGLLVLAVLILGPAVLVALWHPDRDALWRRPAAPSIPLLAVAIVALVAVTPYAVAQLGEQLAAPAGDKHAEEMHYAGMSVLVATLVLGAALAALRTGGWRAVGRLVGVSAVAFGLASLTFPDAVSSLGATGGAIAAGAGALFWVLSQREGTGP
jgi:hypothetical protein